MFLMGITYFNDDIINEISKIKNILKDKNINLGIVESKLIKDEKLIKIYCDDLNHFEARNIFNNYLCKVLYNINIEHYIKNCLDDFLSDSYIFFKSSEIKDFKNVSKKYLLNDVYYNEEFDDFNIYTLNKKEEINEIIKTCLEENTELNILGFMTFRFRIIKEKIDSILSKLMEKYMVEKEYGEFIKLLKYFVELQDPKIEEVNITVTKNDSYLIQDKDGNDLYNKFKEDFAEGFFPDEGSNFDDLLISGLISNSPKRINVFNYEESRNKEIIETIKKVFSDRIHFSQNYEFIPKIKTEIKNTFDK